MLCPYTLISKKNIQTIVYKSLLNEEIYLIFVCIRERKKERERERERNRKKIKRRFFRLVKTDKKVIEISISILSYRK